MSAFIQDVRFGLRMLAKSPGFTAVAVLTLALGIGATTAMFSVIECAVLDPFPFPDIHRIVTLVAHGARWDEARQVGIPSSELLDYQEQSHVFEALMGQTLGDGLLTDYGPPTLLRISPVTVDYFRGFGVPALVGRPLGGEDFKPGAPPVAVLEYGLWRSKFNGDRRVVGRMINLNHQLTTVVGVMPPRSKTFAVEIWIPAPLPENKPPDQQTYFMFFARLKRGITIEQANAEVAGMSQRFAKLYPKVHPDQRTYGVESILTGGMHGLHRTLYFLLGAVGLLLLIACMNVANLLVARATTREREIAIRASLGASCGRVIRQFLIESLLLAFAGGSMGCLFAWKGLEWILALVPRGALPTQAVVRINGPVLLFTVGVTFLSTLLFGLAPAIYAARKDPQQSMQENSRGAGEGRAHGRLRGLLVATEVALSLVLLSGAGLLLRTFWMLQHVDLGYNPDNVLCTQVTLPPERYKTREQRNELTMELLRRVRSLPGVTAAAVGFPPGWGGQIRIGITGKTSTEDWHAEISLASDRYFETLGIPLLQGRAISEEDLTSARKVAVVNRAFVKTYFGTDNPLGRQVEMPELATGQYAIHPPFFEIVGVVGDVRQNYQLDMPPQPGIYVPQSALGFTTDGLLVRTVGKPALLMNPLRREVAAIDRELPLNDPWGMRDLVTLREMLSLYRATPRFMTTLMTAFAALGLVLVSIGVFSVLSYSVSRRTNEIGIRMALGAQVADVVRLVILGGLKWLALGIAVGVPASIALVRIFQNRIWALKSSDPLTLAVVALLLTAVGLAACYIPARRATKVDPMVALRYE
jgi:putative ABC transport system permease protein